MIHLTLPLLPLSVNDMYMTIRKGKATLRVLTKEGRQFKKESESHLARTYPLLLAKLKPNFPYALFLRFHFPKLVNDGWTKRTTARYKRFDVSNRVKVIEDTLVNISGVDDSHFMLVSCEKVQGPVELTDIYIWNLEEEGSPFHAAAISI